MVVIGPSGSGKSTLVNLIPRLYDVTAGSVLFDGTDVRKLDLSYLRDNIGIVSQETYLFNGTIRDNLLYAKPDATEEELIEACKQANIYEFIEKQDDGLDTVVGNRGLKLSGGEKQRVAIARALVNDPQLIIADEPTGNIDPELSYEIVELLKGINDQGTTILMVTHEHDLVRHFGGRIINITEGEIVFDEVITGAGDEYVADMGTEMPAEAAVEAISTAEQADSGIIEEEADVSAELPIEDMSADDIITAIGGIPEPEKPEKELMKPVAENIDVDITAELPKAPAEDAKKKKKLPALTKKKKGGAE